MKKYLLLLTLCFDGVFGMLSVKELIDVMGANNAFAPQRAFPQTEIQKQKTLDAVANTQYNNLENMSWVDVQCIHMVCNFLIKIGRNYDVSELLYKAYRMFRTADINDYWLVQEILKEGKDITVKNIEDHLNRPKIPLRLKMLGSILDSYVKNPSKDLTVYRYGCISSVEAREFLSNYHLYKRRKLMSLHDQERIKAEFLAKIQHMLKK